MYAGNSIQRKHGKSKLIPLGVLLYWTPVIFSDV